MPFPHPIVLGVIWLESFKDVLENEDAVPVMRAMDFNRDAMCYSNWGVFRSVDHCMDKCGVVGWSRPQGLKLVSSTKN